MTTSLREDIERAREWLDNQRAVVHPGPIETIRFALDLAEIVVAHREKTEEPQPFAGLPDRLHPRSVGT